MGKKSRNKKEKKQQEKQKLFIGISGKCGTGKSTISHMLQAVIPNSSIESLAAPLYKAQHILYDEYGLTLEGDKDRPLLIAIGLWGRDRNPDFWLEQFAKRAIESEYQVILCDDVRFPNEAKFFEEHGILVRLEGEQRGANVDPNAKDNPTECALDDYDFKHRISNKDAPAIICSNIAKVLMNEAA